MNDHRISPFNSPSPSRWEEICELVTLVMDGEIEDGQRSRLESLLRDDADARSLYVQFMQESAALRLLASQAENVRSAVSTGLDDLPGRNQFASNGKPHASSATISEHGIDTRSTQVTENGGHIHAALRFLSRPTPLSITVAAIFVGLVVTAMAFIAAPIYRQLAHKSVEPPADGVVIAAQLTGMQDANWAKGQVGTRRGAHLPVGHRMQLLAGLVEVSYQNGTKVQLEGPATYTIESPQAGSLESGKLVATVSPEGKGFEVRAPSARVVDLGTSFGLLVDASGRSHVHVFDGNVDVHSSASPNVSYGRLAAGQSMIVEPDGSSTPSGTIARNEFMPKLLPHIPTVVVHAPLVEDARIFDSDGDGTGDKVDYSRRWNVTSLGEANQPHPDDGNAKRWIAFKIPKELRQHEIESAVLKLTLSNARNVEGLRVRLEGIPDCTSANAMPSDFVRAGELIEASVFDERAAADSSRSIDVSGFLQTEKEKKGEQFVIFRLQVEGQGLPNNDKRANCFLIYNRGANPQWQPVLIIKCRPAESS